VGKRSKRAKGWLSHGERQQQARIATKGRGVGSIPLH